MKLTCTMKQEFKLEPPYGNKTVYLFTLLRNGSLASLEDGPTTIQWRSEDTNAFEMGKEYEIRTEI